MRVASTNTLPSPDTKLVSKLMWKNTAEALLYTLGTSHNHNIFQEHMTSSSETLRGLTQEITINATLWSSW